MMQSHGSLDMMVNYNEITWAMVRVIIRYDDVMIVENHEEHVVDDNKVEDKVKFGDK